ncbi:MAG TPA: helix-turn-helix domain-containing protein [Gaiellaceae bacterium]|nr:helix-turn-helix domain-containing protein [Gaiellaceae bacterium]
MSLLPIGTFSRLTGLTVKQLRHYDQLGLLPPAAVDPDTGYRLYAPEQVERGEAIHRLRGLDLPLEEIAALLDSREPAEIRELLVGHQRRTALRANELRVVLQGLQPLIDGKETVMGTTSESLDDAAHRRLGVDLFNRTWTFIEKETRTQEEDDEMLHCAHASAYHWLHAPHTNANRARSHWQCSRVHVLVNQPEGALHHAKRCLAIVQEHPEEMAEFDLPGAYEALARAHALAGHADEARRFLELGRTAAAKISDDDDRGIIEADLATVPA